LYFDQEKVQLGLYHILQNAIKFNAEIKGMIYINVEYNENKVYYIIKDTGIGMSKRKI
jgi:signal transduction histidine kinase